MPSEKLERCVCGKMPKWHSGPGGHCLFHVYDGPVGEMHDIQGKCTDTRAQALTAWNAMIRALVAKAQERGKRE